MKPLSPVDALGPAFRRTRTVLGQPFRFWFFVKIALVAALTQPSFFSAAISYPMQAAQFALLGRMHHPRTYPPYGNSFQSGPGMMHMGAIALVVLVALIAIGVVVWIAMTYAFCRLRFTLFDLVVYRQGRVGQAWSKYGRQSWRFLGLVVLVMLVFLLAAALTMGPLLLHFVVAIQGMDPQVLQANPFAVLGNIFPLIAIGLVLGLLWSIADAVMQDFLLPPLAIEDASLESSFRRFFGLLGERFGSVLVFLLLRFVVGLGLAWVGLVVVMLIVVVLGLGGAAVGMLLYHSLWQYGLGGHAVFFAYVSGAALVVVGLYLLLLIAVYGAAAIFKQAYAAYFFGSHYPELGYRLEPPDEELVGARVPSPLPPLPSLQEPPPVW
jgi:hypothetical protein